MVGDHNLLLANRWTSNEAEWSIRRGGTNRSLVVQDFWELNQWQHVVATVDDSGLMKLYSNGELKGSILVICLRVLPGRVNMLEEVTGGMTGISWG